MSASESPRTLGEKVYNLCTNVRAQLIGLRDPARAMSYIRGRQALLSYAAGSRRGANGLWNPKNKTVDEMLRNDWRLITARARELERDSGHVSGALTKVCNNVVGDCGIRPQVQLRDGANKLDRKRNRAVEDIWKRWAEHPRVELLEKQELALRHSWIDGEVLLHVYESPTLYRQGIVPMGIEMLEADHLDSSVNGVLANGNRAIRGVEFDAEGFPIAYHLYTEHPGACGSGLRSFSLGKSVRIGADRIIHPFLRTRTSQTRGVSWLVSVIMEMHDFDEYQDSERIAARLTSAFGFFVETAYPETLGSMFGGQGLPGQNPGPSALDGAKIPTHVDPGRVQALPPGTKIHTEGFQRPGSNYGQFTNVSLKGASAGFGMSYEAFSNDYSDASYSSARAATLEERRGYKRQQAYLINKLNRPLWRLWGQFLALSDLAPGLGVEIPVTWQAPGWEWVDPKKDADANDVLLNKLKITSRRRIAASRGDDLDEIEAERAEEAELYGDSDLSTPDNNHEENADAS